VDFAIRHGATEELAGEALALARRLFAVYDEAIDSLALLPTDDDELALYLDGQLVASQRRDGRPPTVAAVRALLAGD
jgi:predicted Rdx family selenoprotein